MSEKDTIPKGKVWTIVEGQPSVPKGDILEVEGTLVVKPETDVEKIERRYGVKVIETDEGTEATDYEGTSMPWKEKLLKKSHALETSPPRTPLTTFMRMQIASGVRDGTKAWSNLKSLAAQKDRTPVFCIDTKKGVARYECKLALRRTEARNSDNVEAVKLEEIDGPYHKTVDRYTFVEMFGKQLKRFG
jgi:hypothetical protein